jgi:hypothetical protein
MQIDAIDRAITQKCHDYRPGNVGMERPARGPTGGATYAVMMMPAIEDIPLSMRHL